MKLFERPKSLADTTAPLLTIVRFLGLRAFEYRGRPRYIISLIYLLALYIFYCCSLDVQYKYYSNYQILKLESVLYKLQMYIASASLLVKLLSGWWYTQKYKDCHQKLTAIEETLRQLGVTVRYNKIYFTMVGLMAVWLVLFCCGWIAAIIFLKEHTGLLSTVYAVLSYSYGVCIDTIIILEFFIFVKCIRMKFELINRLLSENLGDSLSSKDTRLGVFTMDNYACIMNYERRRHAFAGNVLTRHRQKSKSRIISVIENQNSLKSRVQSTSQSEEKSRNQQQEDCSAKIERRKCLLQIIKQVHLELCKVSKTLCTIFGVQIAWEIGISIAILTALCYSWYIRYVTAKQYKQYKLLNHIREETITNVILSIFNVSKLILLSRGCKSTADEGNKTIEIIRATYGCDAEADLTDEIQQFGIQILQSPVAFTAFGVSLDNAILTTLIVYFKDNQILTCAETTLLSGLPNNYSLRFITTYLVIMIQVSNSLESNKAIKHANI